MSSGGGGGIPMRGGPSQVAADAGTTGSTPTPSTSSTPARVAVAPPKKGFKVVLLGDASVGKSSILQRFLQNKFSEGIETTIGGAFSSKTIECRGRKVKFDIWDTAGQERFRSLAPMYYRGASAAIVVYDQTNEVTFERAQAWVKQVMTTCSNSNIVIAVAANKADMVDKRQVPFERAEAFAESEGLLLMETSAMTGKNVARLFETIAEHLPDEPFVPEQGRSLQLPPSAAGGASASAAVPQQRRGCCQG
mmetsp:Transcript_71325/g.204652  ORF Transcript_71325/g.204652 Transcript_71325/m.204652 type:complete len:250 (-) Transcript_71325:164-913(-)